jgi:osmotically-inducible protein OsmY
MDNFERFRRVKRKEFGHGQNMDPGRMDVYGDTSHRGWSTYSNIGRDYETNAGYRDNYNRLRNEQQREEDVQQRKLEGQHRGKGPKSYRRSDDRIREEINDRLSESHDIDASDIEVIVENGDVILSGMVESRHAKRLAEDIGESISGVKNIENRLRIRPQGA